MTTKRPKHNRAILKYVRESLQGYGARDTESIREVVMRFLSSYGSALQRASEAEASAEEANARAAVAERTRDAAQAQSNTDLDARRQAQHEADMLRREVAVLNSELDELRRTQDASER